ncbi:MAG: hypothetical protein PHQ35_09755 [Phycisphaerae bacterium]|nr:hypothetical protein [Phycisphaerae bacterium]MDD5239986.1 hypothetical protein [Candidatus Nanoarchaeia archaeon]
MNDVINHKTGSFIWYHSTPKERLDNIRKEGLKINSEPSWQGEPEPWIYVSTIPWNAENNVVLEVDLSFLNTYECGWPFVDKDTPLEDLWQLRVFKDIPLKYIEVRR